MLSSLMVHARKTSWGITCCANTCGAIFALARIQANIFEEVFPDDFAIFLGNSFRREYMPRL